MRLRTSQRDEHGIAMVMTVMIIFIAAMIVAVVLQQGNNTERASGRGANWNDALQTADAGVSQAVALMQAAGGNPGNFTGQTEDGTYSVTVTHLGRRRYEIVSTGVSGNAQGLRRERTVHVIMAPPKMFEYALFSLTDVDTKNQDIINGDVWANGSVEVEANDIVYGDVTAATGFVTMDTGALIDGDVITGGYDSAGRAMKVVTINGSATAASTSPDCADDPGHGNYKITGGTVKKNATSWGTILSTVQGTKTPLTCVAAPATKPLPTFTYNPANYDPAPVEFSSPAAFNAYIATHKTNMQGTFYITGGGANEPVDITGITVTADLNIISMDAPITADQGTAAVAAGNTNDKVVVLVSYYTPEPNVACSSNGGNPGDCAIGVKNSFAASDNTAMLVYAPNGPVAFKNSGDFFGAAYANNIVMKNNQNTTWDSRVERVVGFGPVTLERESWVEVSD
jgi:hypothetical protein